MSRPAKLWTVLWFALATLISAFLVFQVQPVISKTVLPWFGGSPAVWTTCMLFFQVLLFAGYGYAHLTTRFLPIRWQGLLHFCLLIAALGILPITPDDSWKPTHSQSPSWQLLLILVANVGLPYFLLASTGPLLQAWFSQRLPERSPYRLYALSNVGSLAALISYPFVVEPALSTTSQGSIWSVAFCFFALVCGYLAIRNWSQEQAPADVDTPAPVEPPAAGRYGGWLVLPAFASVALLAVTNHVSQDVAVIPFMWVAPLSLYLLTFIICFDREQWYSRRWCAVMATVSGILLCLMIDYGWNQNLLLEIGIYLNLMFWICMLCHGELVRSKPAPQYLTSFYLMCSAGGAVGGATVALLCPIVFAQHWEMNLTVIVGTSLGILALLLDGRQSWLGTSWKRMFIGGLTWVAVLCFVVPVQFADRSHGGLATVRNFYGVLHVKRDDDERGTLMVHGRTVHGFQFRNPLLHQVPTTYYSPGSGIGVALSELWPDQPIRVGAVGLGCGTIAAYGREGDHFRFYEINPAVEVLAREHFTFLEDSQADTEVILGDARLSLEREENQQFDVLVLDAFSSDAIPTHLLTREAFAVYQRHLRPNGLIAIHVSNRNLDLTPVVVRLATHYHLDCLQVGNRGHGMQGSLDSKWMLLTHNQDFVTHSKLISVARHFPAGTPVNLPLWTDRYNNLFQIMKAF